MVKAWSVTGAESRRGGDARTAAWPGVGRVFATLLPIVPVGSGGADVKPAVALSLAMFTYHLNRAMDAGLTRAQASEMLTQLAFYAGWPNVFSAMPVVKAVFESARSAEEEP